MPPRLPPFLIKAVPKRRNMIKVRALFSDTSVHTVCEEARCPNIGECFSRQTCAFLILGATCTRGCAFCGVKKGIPLPPDQAEPERIAAAVSKLGLNYVVITSVTRDDLPDGGAAHFAAVITQIQTHNSKLRTEVLIPDFQGNQESLGIVLDASPFVLNHNVETVPRLYSEVRPRAIYRRSLKLLSAAKRSGRVVYTKSGFMVGLGEAEDEVLAVIEDLRGVGCDLITIGQYLPPSRAHRQPERYVTPEEFARYAEVPGVAVIAGPFVRSSYQAEAATNHVKS